MPKQKLEFGLVVSDVNARQAVDGLADSMDKAGGAADKLSKQTSKVDDELKATRSSLLELQREFDRTGNIDLLGKIGRAQGRVTRLERIRKSLDDAAEQAGKSFVDTFISVAGAALSAGGRNPYVTAGITALAVAAAPGVATLLSAAVVGGVGIGGIVGGVALAAQDPRVQAAGKEVGETLSDEFQDAASGFVEPVLRSLNKVGNAGWADKLAPSFDKLASHVDPLTDGLMGLVDKALPGLEDAVDAAGPTLDVLARELPEIGSAIGGFFSDLAEDPETAALAVENLLIGVEDFIRASGEFVASMVEIYKGAYEVADVLGLIEPRLKSWTKGTDEGTGSQRNFGRATSDAAEELQDFERAIDEVFGRTLNVKDATINYEQAVDDLVEGLTDGKRTLNENTQAGRDNWQVIQDNARAIEGMRDANIAAKMPLDQANKLYEQQFEDLRKTLLNLGYNKTAVNEYIDSLKGIPRTAKTTIYLETRVSGAVSAIMAGAASVPGHASGGLVTGPGTDTSDDIVARLSNGEYVIKAAAARRIGVDTLDHLNAGGSIATAAGYQAPPTAATAGGWGGGVDLETAMVRALRTVPIMRLPDDAVTADHLHRGG